jgi:hypothetical protein
MKMIDVATREQQRVFMFMFPRGWQSAAFTFGHYRFFSLLLTPLQLRAIVVNTDGFFGRGAPSAFSHQRKFPMPQSRHSRQAEVGQEAAVGGLVPIDRR